MAKETEGIGELSEEVILERIKYILRMARFIQDDKATVKFASYLAELFKWNKKINLTSIVSLDELIEKQLLDSLIPLRLGSELIQNYSVLLDIGSGGGFPALPLKIAKGNNISVHMVESRIKKVNFLKHIVRKLELNDINAWCGKFPLESHEENFSEHFDIVTTKAVKPDASICNAICKVLKEQGQAIFYRLFEEDDYKMIKSCGLIVAEEISYILPISRGKRTLTVIRRKS
ncbi:MAG: 16S rRNA (guanine(527)-N(7))-methyltransferase RsmG [Candidatus Schekmanbacteria bacterium]|nr:16S rRNA (guanine(527)-N(7))-methyltransferase RsmG [Candidatus Schekmanbacteria bacterium]